MQPKKESNSIAAFIVPTGVGARIGGFAGDASPYARKLSEVCPLIVNPNVVNAAVFSGINDKMLYTEGFAIDRFFKGEIALKPSKSNEIGVIFDKAIPQNVLNIHINTINAVEAVYGIKTIGYEITEEAVGVEFGVNESGISSGFLKNPQALIEAGKKLIMQGAEALAVVCLFENSNDDEYAKGTGVDPVGGVEAVISHLLTKEFNIPVAHAPAFVQTDISSEIVDKRAAAEYITPTFLPCVLLGLYNAPKLIDIKYTDEDCIELSNLRALIMPQDCLGGLPVLKAYENNIPIVAVKENSTILNITAAKLGLKKVIEVECYDDAEEFLKKLVL